MPVELMLRTSERLKRFVEFVGRWGAVFILPLVFVTMWDVFLRKVGGMQSWLVEHLGRPFESTVIQEMEWHFHTALFTLVLGYGVVRNRHVRVDLLREKMNFRKQAWIEFLGVTFFLIPYCLIVGYFALGFAWDSFLVNEKSASTVGLSYRWIIKSVLVFGLLVAFVAGIAVWLQTAVVLFGPRDLRFKLMTLQWPEDVVVKRPAASTGATGAGGGG
jgi:TRAP-type mannitol/chloroaromatic compound transport system permease small subunit